MPLTKNTSQCQAKIISNQESLVIVHFSLCGLLSSYADLCILICYLKYLYVFYFMEFSDSLNEYKTKTKMESFNYIPFYARVGLKVAKKFLNCFLD